MIWRRRDDLLSGVQTATENGVIPCLLQIHIAQEETKFGFSFDECTDMLEKGEWNALKNVSIQGLMGMASNTDNIQQIRKEFRLLHSYFQATKNRFFTNNDIFRELSMGMSHDYSIAVEEGATLVRVGSKIFGERAY